MSERDPVCKVCGTPMSEHPYLGLPCERLIYWMDRYEKFSLAACRARIAELEAALAEERADHANCRHNRQENLRNLNRVEERIRELEACVLEYWNAKDWDAVGAADATAAKLIDMKAGAAKIADTSLTPTVDRGGAHG